MEKIYQSHSEKETAEVAEKLAKELAGGEILCLTGELGSGKTTFVTYLARSLGVEDRILSPTFVLLRSYHTSHPTINTLHHIDAYRVDDIAGLESVGLSELLEDKTAVVAIEWGEKLWDYLPVDRLIRIRFENVGETIRRIEVSSGD